MNEEDEKVSFSILIITPSHLSLSLTAYMCPVSILGGVNFFVHFEKKNKK